MADLNVIVRTPLATLANYMSWGNRANGALLVATGLIGLITTIMHPGLDFLGSLLVAVYVSGLGGLLLRYDLATAGDLRRDFGFMYTYLGRAAFLLLAANLAWTCAPFGWIAALVTNANALLSAYIMYAHPSFTSGQASAVAIGGVDGEAGDELFVGRSSSADSFDRSGFDPASEAARARAASGGY